MRPVRLNVEPRVVAGLRGGEDLFLDFTCETFGDKIPDRFTTHLNVDDDTEGYNVKRLDPKAEDKWARSKSSPYKGEVLYQTHHYEIEWKGTPDAAFALVKAEIEKPTNWRYCHRVGEGPRLRFEFSLYIAGNAE